MLGNAPNGGSDWECGPEPDREGSPGALWWLQFLLHPSDEIGRRGLEYRLGSPRRSRSRLEKSTSKYGGPDFTRRGRARRTWVYDEDPGSKPPRTAPEPLMNYLTWRNRRRRGVSDILATILLVAIVVVLVAVLFILDSALTHGPGNSPIGSALAVGGGSPATKCSGVGIPTIGCLAANDHVYTLVVAHSTVAFGDVLFEVKTPTGVPYIATTDGGFNILNIVGSTVAAYNLTVSGPLVVPDSGSWAYFSGTGVGAGTPLTTTSTIVVDMGSVDPTGQGYEFLVAGTGHYSGTTTAV